MPRIEIREAFADDIPYLVQLDHTIETQQVWQMEWSPTPTLGATFRPASLPRPAQLAYPHNPQQLTETWQQRPGVLVALHRDLPVGYAAFAVTSLPHTAWLSDLVVDLPWRRQGIGQALLVMSLRWAALQAYRRLIFAVPFRNDPGIQLALKLGFAFIGFQYGYYPNGDTALFFQRSVSTA